jgi:hypothetical protein
MLPDTLKNVLPYDFHKLPGDRIMIVHPAGVKYTACKAEVQHKLETGIPLRDLSSHERMMWETALKVLEGE